MSAFIVNLPHALDKVSPVFPCVVSPDGQLEQDVASVFAP